MYYYLLLDRMCYHLPCCLFDYVLNVNYIEHCAEKDCPNFIKFIKTSAGLENYQCILISLGFGISSLTNVKKAIFLFGETDGG